MPLHIKFCQKQFFLDILVEKMDVTLYSGLYYVCVCVCVCACVRVCACVTSSYGRIAYVLT
jgi:hypothetical protein